MQVNCAISGIKFSVPEFEPKFITAKEGYFHPIFAAPYSVLLSLYSAYTRNELSDTEAYLTYCAILYSSDALIFESSFTANPNSPWTKKLIANTINKAISVIQQSHAIHVPAFKQPCYKVNTNTNNMHYVEGWIEAWEDNIITFKRGIKEQKEYEALARVENKLSKVILAGLPLDKIADTIAAWASIAADFPQHKKTNYMRVITQCCNKQRMFTTPLALIKEVREYCELNILPDSLHYHYLNKALDTAIHNHHDYLGYQMLDTFEATNNLAISLDEQQQLEKSYYKNKAEAEAICNSAPNVAPIESDYPSKLEYIKARLAYQVKQSTI